MFNLGAPEIMVILLVALIVIGPKKLPDAAKQLGRALHEFRRVSGGMRQDLQDALGVDDIRDAFDLNRLLDDDASVHAAVGSSMVVGSSSGDFPSVVVGDRSVPAPDGYPTPASDRMAIGDTAATALGAHFADVPPPPAFAPDPLG